MAARLPSTHYLQPYKAPEFVSGKLAFVPSHRVALARTPTPLRPWTGFPTHPSSKVFIKLDEETGYFSLSPQQCPQRLLANSSGLLWVETRLGSLSFY